MERERESITGQFKKTWGVWFSLHHLEESSMASLATPIGLSHGPLTPRCHPPNLGGEPRRIGASYGLNLRQTKDLDWLNGTFGATFQAPLLRVLRDETRRLLHRSRGLKDKLVSRWCQVVPGVGSFFRGGGGNSQILLEFFTPKIRERRTHFDSYFSNGLKPPTSIFFCEDWCVFGNS